jgi:tetratricopeptide (TPR) repeat protein
MKMIKMATCLSLLGLITAGYANESADPEVVHYNLGVNLTRQGRPDEAVREFQNAIQISPEHSDSWLALAKLEDDRGHRVRAFVSYLRFLTLDPHQESSAEAAARVWDLLFQGVEPHQKVKKSSITIEPPGDKSDPWWQCSMMMSMSSSLRKTKKAALMSDAEFFSTNVKGLSIFLDSFVKKSDVDPFWKTQVVNYFNDAREAAHIEALGYYVRQAAEDEDVATWIRANRDAVVSFQRWSNEWSPASN